MQSSAKGQPRLGARQAGLLAADTQWVTATFGQALLHAEVQLEKTQPFGSLLVLGPSAYPSGILIKEV